MGAPPYHWRRTIQNSMIVDHASFLLASPTYHGFVEFYCTGYHTYVRKYLHDIRGMYATISIVIHHRRWSISYTLMAVQT